MIFSPPYYGRKKIDPYHIYFALKFNLKLNIKKKKKMKLYHTRPSYLGTSPAANFALNSFLRILPDGAFGIEFVKKTRLILL